MTHMSYSVQLAEMDEKGKVFLFFFSSRRRHTRSLCDWSSDVCSSDLEFQNDSAAVAQLRGFRHHRIPIASDACQHPLHVVIEIDAFGRGQNLISAVHSGADRKSVV